MYPCVYCLLLIVGGQSLSFAPMRENIPIRNRSHRLGLAVFLYPFSPSVAFSYTIDSSKVAWVRFSRFIQEGRMTKKKTAVDARLVEGQKLLEQWGISLAGLQDKSLSVSTVEERIGQDARADLALAVLLGDYPVSEAASVLVSWEARLQDTQGKQDRSLRRSLHRSLYKLSQKGIAVKRPAQEQAKSILAPIEPEGYVSSMDRHGDRLVWLLKPRTGGGLHYLSALINEPDGMRTIEAAEVNRKGIKLAQQDLATQYQISMVEAPWQYCDFLMHEGYERAKARKTQGGQAEQAEATQHMSQTIDAYPAMRSHILSSPAKQTAVPLPDSLNREAIAADENLLATSTQLFEEPELQRWLLDHDQAHTYVDKLNQAQDSPLVLNKYQQQDRAQSVIDEALGDLFADDKAQIYARRLEETAFYLAATSRLDSAQRALAVSIALKQSEQGGKGIPFCEELIQQSIAMQYHEERQQEREAAPGSLIMKPAEFASRMQLARQRTGR